MEINLCKWFKTDTLRHRDTARKILKKIEAAKPGEPITLDFSGIIFVSRSFSHELRRGLKNRDVKYVNMQPEVDEMMQLAVIKPKVRFKEDYKVKKLELLAG